MNQHLIDREMLEHYYERLVSEEKSTETIRKYRRDMEKFCLFAGGRAVNKELVILYKQYLVENYTARSVNTMLASLNGFLKDMGWYDCVVKTLRIQPELFRVKGRELTRKEYYRLLDAAKQREDQRLWLIMQTLCATGIRVGELRYITVEAVEAGYAYVNFKGKVRSIILPPELCALLKVYIAQIKRQEGSVFVTRNGRPLDRSNICRDMKKLCTKAGVDRRKVFPHNLRHLFACEYLEKCEDPITLADLMGHTSLNTTRIYTRRSIEEQARLLGEMRLVVI
ncbi:MAG: site-specific integrase [Clostridiales bacterium]|nr:site-specific integrase [Clostridiales bacterium]